MDPAGPDPIREALSNQGVLVGRHDQMLREVMDNLASLAANVAQMGHHLNLVSTHLAPPAPEDPAPPQELAPFPAQPALPSREPNIPTPERYAGALGTCKSFLMQCSLVFEQQPSTYANDRAKICYMIGLLTGSALAWASAVWESQSNLCYSYPEFTEEMKKVFHHPVSGRDATKRLLSLRQGSRSVAEYSVEFRTLAAEAEWNDTALQGVFQMRNELAVRDESANLDELVSLAIRLDNRLRERRRERASRSPGSLPSRPVSSPLARFRSETFPSPSAPSEVFSPLLSSEEPMQLGRARITPQERLRRIRRRTLCLLCSLRSFRGHMPPAPKRGCSPVKVGILVSKAVSSSTPQTRKPLEATLLLNQQSLSLPALVDSGADESFLDAQLVASAGISTQPLTAPLNARGLNGKLLARVTHVTEPLHLVLSGNHHEMIQFHVMSSPHTPLVLGQPWLKLHNPHMDWSENQVRSWSSFCHSSCLRSAIPPAEVGIPPVQQEPLNLSAVPPVYHSLGEVFSKQRALFLPPHRPYNRSSSRGISPIQSPV